MVNKVPRRPDGMLDLKNWQAYTEANGIKTMSDIRGALRSCGSPEEVVILHHALSARRSELAEMVISAIEPDNMTVQEALQILDTAKEKLLNTVIVSN